MAVKIVVVDKRPTAKSKVRTLKKNKGNSHLSNKLPKG